MRGNVGLIALTWLSQLALWLAFANNAGVREIAMGALASSLATFSVFRFSHTSRDHFHLRGHDLAQIAYTPQIVFSGTWVLLRVIAMRFLGRHAPAGVAAVHYDMGGNDPVSCGRRGLSITFLTMAPNNLVLGFLAERQWLLFHTVIPQALPSFMFQMGASLENDGPNK